MIDTTIFQGNAYKNIFDKPQKRTLFVFDHLLGIYSNNYAFINDVIKIYIS
jgi:hypothetical protein